MKAREDEWIDAYNEKSWEGREKGTVAEPDRNTGYHHLKQTVYVT
jgi:hypothetical protein